MKEVVLTSGDPIQTIGAIVVAFIVGAVLMAVPMFAAAGAMLTLFAWVMVIALFVGVIAMLSKFRF